jgi:DNA segregation ATPase FtsK/SpoIIIE-like protein
VIVIDEFADLMLAGRAQAEAFLRNVQRVAQVGRSRMVHLVLATQRPDKETIRGAIKTNLDARVVMRLPTAADSMTVLGRGGAERLLKYGDLLFECGGNLTRLQGYAS